MTRYSRVWAQTLRVGWGAILNSSFLLPESAVSTAYGSAPFTLLLHRGLKPRVNGPRNHSLLPLEGTAMWPHRLQQTLWSGLSQNVNVTSWFAERL